MPATKDEVESQPIESTIVTKSSLLHEESMQVLPNVRELEHLVKVKNSVLEKRKERKRMESVNSKEDVDENGSISSKQTEEEMNANQYPKNHRHEFLSDDSKKGLCSKSKGEQDFTEKYEEVIKKGDDNSNDDDDEWWKSELFNTPYFAESDEQALPDFIDTKRHNEITDVSSLPSLPLSLSSSSLNSTSAAPRLKYSTVSAEALSYETLPFPFPLPSYSEQENPTMEIVDGKKYLKMPSFVHNHDLCFVFNCIFLLFYHSFFLLHFYFKC